MSHTRGVKKLKTYLGADEPILSQAKTAKDVAPVLIQKALDQRSRLQTSKPVEEQTEHDVSSNINNKMSTASIPNMENESTHIDASTITQYQDQDDQLLLNSHNINMKRNMSLSESILEYLRQYCIQSTDKDTPAIHSISKKQLQLIQSLSNKMYNGNNNSESEAAHITINRACLHHVDSIADTLALAALERANAGADNGLEQSTILVLVEDLPAALTLRRRLMEKYKLRVLLLASEDEEAQYATKITEEVDVDVQNHNNNVEDDISTDDCDSAMSRAKQKAMIKNNIVDTNRFPTFPYAKKDNNKVSLTPPRSPTRAIMSRQQTSYHTVTPKANKNHIEHKNEEKEEDKTEMLNKVQEPVVIVLATPGVMTTVDKRSAL